MEIEDGEWPAGYTIEPTVLENEDECHREVGGVSNKGLQRLFNAKDWRIFKICDPDGVRLLTEADLAPAGS